MKPCESLIHKAFLFLCQQIESKNSRDGRYFVRHEDYVERLLSHILNDAKRVLKGHQSLGLREKYYLFCAFFMLLFHFIITDIPSFVNFVYLCLRLNNHLFISGCLALYNNIRMIKF